MKTLTLILYLSIYTTTVWSGNLFAPRAPFSITENPSESIRHKVSHEFGFIIPPDGSFGIIVTQHSNEWGALYVAPSDKVSVEISFIGCGAIFGDRDGKIIRLTTDIDSIIAKKIYQGFCKEIFVAKNTPSSIKDVDVGVIEYWVSVKGEVIAGYSFSRDDNPEGIRNIYYNLMNLLRTTDEEKEAIHLKLAHQADKIINRTESPINQQSVTKEIE